MRKNGFCQYSIRMDGFFAAGTRDVVDEGMVSEILFFCRFRVPWLVKQSFPIRLGF